MRFVRDVHLSLRGFRRAPTFALTATIILGLGIAAATAISAVIQRVLIQPLPVADPDRLFVLSTHNAGLLGEAGSPAGMPHVDELRRNGRVFVGVAAVQYRGARPRPFVDGDRTLNLSYALVTGDFFQVLGTRPLLGRLLSLEDEKARDGRAIVLSYHAWRRAFGGDPRIIGRQLLDPHTNLYSTILQEFGQDRVRSRAYCTK